MTNQTLVSTCATTACAYNNGGCTALAVTIGGTGARPTCATFVKLDARAGLPVANGRVGACQRLECVHNKDLLCTAPAIDVAGDTAECASSTARCRAPRRPVGRWAATPRTGGPDWGPTSSIPARVRTCAGALPSGRGRKPAAGRGASPSGVEQRGQFEGQLRAGRHGPFEGDVRRGGVVVADLHQGEPGPVHVEA